MNRDSNIVICFYSKPDDIDDFAYKIEIREGRIYTGDGYISTPLTDKINFTFDDRTITGSRSNGKLWLCFRPKRSKNHN